MLTKVDIAAFAAGQGMWHWIVRLGAFGFIPLGIADASVIPLPGSMDVLTVVLASRQKELWPFYAAMATLGSVIGGYLTYRLALKGGQETFEKKTSPRMVQKVRRIFDRSGFGAIALPALLPPPVPMVPFVMAAGAAKYPLKKFLLALTLGRLVRYSLLGFFAARYGRAILTSLADLEHPLPVILVTLALLLAGIVIIVIWRRRGQRQTTA
jgi:membrane protein DedA with SNARE-associated domain